MTIPPLTPDPAIIAAHQALSQAVAGPTPTGITFHPIATRAQPTITAVQPLRAKAPKKVTITGTDLDTTFSVHIGGQTAQNVKAAPTQVTFDTTGLLKGTAKILVMTNLGGVLSREDFTVL